MGLILYWSKFPQHMLIISWQGGAAVSITVAMTMTFFFVIGSGKNG